MHLLQKQLVSQRYVRIVIPAIILLTRVPGLILASPDRLLNDSEFEMTLGMLDRFLGSPSSILLWPAGPLHMVALPVFGLDFLVSTRFSVSAAAFVAYLCDMYRQPFHALWLARLSVATLSSLCFAALFPPFARVLRSRLQGLLAVGALATVPLLWSHSHMAVPDSLAFALACAAASPLLAAQIRPRDILTAGLLAGLALSAKVTVIPVVPFLLAILLQNYARLFRGLFSFAGSLLLGFAIGCPYLWTDPVRLVKTVVGNAARPGNPLGFARALATTAEVIPIWLLALMIGGFVALVIRRRYWLVAGSTITLGMTIAILAAAGVTFPRYCLPIAPVAAVLGVLALAEAQDYLNRRSVPQRYVRAGIVLVLALTLGGNTALYSARLPNLLAEFQHLDASLQDLEALGSGASLVVPYDNYFYYVAGGSSSAALERLAADCAAAISDGRQLADFVSRTGMPRDLAAALPRVFDAQEQDFVAQARLMSYPGNRSGFALRLWAADALAPRFGFLTRDQAIAMFESGEVDAIVVNTKPQHLTPIKAYADRWFLFARAQPSVAGRRSGILSDR